MTDTDDDRDEWPVVQLLTTATATGCDTAPRLCSVFHLDRFTVTMRGKPPTQESRRLYRVDRLEGVTRCTAIQPQDTAEWKTKEAARRAKQILPKPPKTARTMSKGLATLLGASH